MKRKKAALENKQPHRERDQRSRRDNQAGDNRGIIRDTADKPQNRIHS